MKKSQKKTKVIRKFSFTRFFIFLFTITLAILSVIYFFYNTNNKAENQPIVNSMNTTKEDINPQFEDKRFEDYTNILILGVDDSNLDGSIDKHRYADAIEILSFDEKNDALRIIAIPRNLVINSGKNGDVLINSIYYDYGGAETVNVLAKYLKIPITKYIAINRSTLKEIIDAFDGIYLYIPKKMHYEDPHSNTNIHIEEGYQKLDGTLATNYLSYKSDDLEEFGRIQRQEQFLRIFYREFTATKSIKNMPNIFSILKSNADTNISFVSPFTIIDYLKAFSSDNIQVKTLPGVETKEGNFVSSEDEIKLLVDELFPEEN